MIRVSYEREYPDGIHCYVFYSQYNDFHAAYHEFADNIMIIGYPKIVAMELCQSEPETRNKRIPRNAVSESQTSMNL